MLFALSPRGLHELIVTTDPFNNVVAGSKVCVTLSLLSEYEQYFRSHSQTERDLYEAFLRGVHARLKAVAPTSDIRARASFPEQVAAAVFGGKNLVVAEECPIVISDAALLQALGVRVGTINNVFESTCQNGFEPFERFVLRHGESGPPEMLARFFLGEKDAIFYDKFVNERSLDFIEYLVSKMDPGGNILIATSDRQGSMDAQAIRVRVARWALKVSVALVDSVTATRLHDRHVFVGHHYQFHVPRGLDIFGRGPEWVHENGRVDVYDRYQAEKVNLSFKREGGGGQRRPISLPAAVIG